MFEMKRRHFLGISAAGIAMVAVPALACWSEQANLSSVTLVPPPELGRKYYVQVWMDPKTPIELVFDYFDNAFRRIENIDGVFLGKEKYDFTRFYPDVDAPSVSASRKIIGYV